jgi:hypothetical protein
LHANAFVLAAILALAASCVAKVDEGTPVAGDGEHIVTLSFTVPGPPASRAMNEDAVETIDVLLFDQGTGKIVYRAIGSTPVLGQFTVKLPDGTYDAVVLANARAMIPAAYPPATTGTSFTNDTREDVLAAIKQKLSNPANKWTADFDRVPMWGYKNNFIVTSGNSANVTLTRMIAKIDVVVDTENVTDFWLESIRLYNYSSEGTIAPAAKSSAPNQDGYDNTQWNGAKAIAPHLPTGSKVAAGVHVDYLIDAAPSDEVTATPAPVYTFEAAAGVAHPVTGWQENTCLVIGGYYKDKTTPTYYRVEFAKKEDNDTYTYLPFLRNHHYTVTIAGVSAHGWSTPDDAYDHEPSNIVVQITEWNDGGLDDITFDPQHYIAVDKSELVFYMEGYAKSMSVKTDFPAGWKLSDRPSWLTTDPDPAGGAPDVTTNLTLTADGIGAGEEREGFFYIVAGNLRKKIIVRQLAGSELSLGAAPEEVVFYKTPAGAKTVTLTPLGGSAFTFDVTGSLTWESGWDPGVPGNASNFLSGNILNIWPGVNNAGFPLGGAVVVTLNGSNGESVTRAVNVRQLDREMLFEPTLENPYPSAAGNYTFTVKSEAPWKLTESPDETFFELKEDESGYHPVATAFTYNFSLTSNAFSFTQREAVISVTSNHPEFYPIPAVKPTFKIIQQAGATPYINIITPDPPAHDFGSSATPTDATVTFKTNANWYIETGANHAKVISGATYNSASLAAGLPSQTGASTPADVFDGTVTFAPVDHTAGLAGSAASTTLKFKTDAGVTTEAEAGATFTRTIPTYFNYRGYSTNGTNSPTATNTSTIVSIPPAGQKIWLHAATNINWYGRLGASGSAVNTPAVTAYAANSTREMTVPALAATNEASWTGNVTTAVWYGHRLDGTGKPNPETSAFFNVRQAPYTLSLSDIPAEVGRTATSVSVNVTTNAPTYDIALKSGGVEIASTGWTSGTGVRTLPLTTTSTARTVDIYNNVNGVRLGGFEQLNRTIAILAGPFRDWLDDNGDEKPDNVCPTGYYVVQPGNYNTVDTDKFKFIYTTNGEDKVNMSAEDATTARAAMWFGTSVVGPSGIPNDGTCKMTYMLRIENGDLYINDVWTLNFPIHRQYDLYVTCISGSNPFN